MKKMAKMRALVSGVHKELWQALLCITAVILLYAAGTLERMEMGLFDLRFRFKTPPPVSKKIVVLAIDDTSLKSVGRWPWRRTVHGKALDLLKGFGVRQVIFDVEFTESSARALNQQDLELFPQEVTRKLDELAGLAAGLKNVVAGGGNLPQALADFSGHIADRKRDLLSLIGRVGQDDDLAFSLAIGRSGNVVLAVRSAEEPVAETPRHEYVLNNYLYKPAPGQDVSGYREARWLDIPANPLHRAADRLAFTDVDKDKDGVRRHISLFRRYKERLVPQLAFAGAMRLLGVAAKDIIIASDRVIIANCLLPGRTERTAIGIPVNAGGQVLVNWAGPWEKTFTRISYHQLFDYLSSQQQRRATLAQMDKDLFGGQLGLDLINNQLAALEQKQGSGIELTTDELKTIPQLAEVFRTAVTNALVTLATGIADKEKGLAGLAAEQRQKAGAEIDLLKKLQKQYGSVWSDLVKDEAEIAKPLAGAIVIVGQTASSTTDLGTTPIDTNSPQVFLHANLYNSILQNSFMRKASPLLDLLLLVVLTLLFAWISQRLAPSRVIVLGLSMLAGYAVLNTLVFSALRIWFDFVAVELALGAAFATITSIRYLAGDKEKKYIKTAFQHYVAAEVVEDLVAGRANLKLGGERKVITAFFSDVQGFSSISEKLKPDELVELLNDYLTDMTDIVMAHKGTVDKFEGDAVIAMYGAPVYYEDHALRACLSCIDQQAKIREKAPFWKEKYGCDFFVRMGLNTGPMVVGNMGSRNRFDYTMMGDAVNLAARLEGVNKYYYSATMISQYTFEAAGDAIVAREIDVLRVVGKKDPVTVYELLTRRDDLDPATEEKLVLFAKALALYRKKKWVEAGESFSGILDKFPADGPSRAYRERCAEFIKTPPPNNWDGVYTLKGK